MTPNERFSFLSEYFTSHWWEFYDSALKPDRLADYRIMQSVTHDPQTICLLRVFWCRNQQFGDFYRGRQRKAVIDTLVSIRTCAHTHGLKPEEAICWFAWCKAILEAPGIVRAQLMPKLTMEGTLYGLRLLQKLPTPNINHYHRATYDITHHLWWLAIHFFRNGEYALAIQLATLGDKFADPEKDTMKGHPFGYRFYKWQLLNLVGSCHLRLGRYDQAIGCFRRAALFAQSGHDQLRRDVSYGNMGIALDKLGQPDAARKYMEKARAAAREGKDEHPEQAARDAGPLSDIHFQLANYDKAYQFNPSTFKSLSPDNQFTIINQYLSRHWQEFYDSIQQPSRQAALFSVYRFMRSQATAPQNNCLLRVFSCRNQQSLDVSTNQKKAAVIDSLTYAHGHNLKPRKASVH
nr:tetratricopeptide repeat protein [uncultured Arsenicibacter sp.]